MAVPIAPLPTIFLTPSIAIALVILLITAITMLNNYLNDFLAWISKNLINCLNKKLMGLFKLTTPPLANGNLDFLDDFRTALYECGLKNDIITCHNNTCQFGKFRKKRHDLIQSLHSILLYIGFPLVALLLTLSITKSSWPPNLCSMLNLFSIIAIIIVGFASIASVIIASSTYKSKN